MPSKNFFSKVYEVVIQIPEGRVTSYGAIANYLVAHNRTYGRLGIKQSQHS